MHTLLTVIIDTVVHYRAVFKIFNFLYLVFGHTELL